MNRCSERWRSPLSRLALEAAIASPLLAAEMRSLFVVGLGARIPDKTV
ncbi:hypothetical protein [Phormidesmis priestleyi]